MPKISKIMPSFEGVAVGQTATCRLPIGNTYNQILITYSGATLAQLETLRLVANGKPIWSIAKAGSLDFMNRFEGRTAAGATNGILVMDLNRYGLKTREGIELTGLGTGMPNDPNPITTLAIEIKIAAGATNPVLSATAIQSAPRVSGLIKKIREFTYAVSAVGVKEISDLPKGALIDKIFFGGHSSYTYNTLEIERDSRIIFSRSIAVNRRIQSDGVRKPMVSADMVVYDPSEEGNGSEALVTAGVQDLRFKLDVSAATTGRLPVRVVYLEELGL